MGKKKSTKSQAKISFWQNVWSVIRNKKDTDGKYTKLALGGTMAASLNSLAILLCLLSAFGVFAMIRQVCVVDWSGGLWFSNVLTLLFLGLLCVSALIFALLLRGCANEVEREDDKNYIVAVFSALTSFAALVVALVALLKE